jgi:hypothetical protein
MSITQALLADVLDFIERHDLYETQFGKLAVRDPSFVSRLRSGQVDSVRRIERVRKFMVAYDKSHPVKKKRRSGLERVTEAA